jgi:hypothetical protein
MPGRPESPATSNEDARKDRINADIVALMCRPSPMNAPRSVQGIGLYTHAIPLSGSPNESSEYSGSKAGNAVFLPIGGPDAPSRTTFGPRAPMNKDFELMWKNVEATVNEEAKHLAQSRLTTEQLKERYGALDVPDANPEVSSPTQNAERLKQWAEYLQEYARRAQPSGDVIMGGTEPTSNQVPAANTATTPTENIYHQSRDPRRRSTAGIELPKTDKPKPPNQ